MMVELKDRYRSLEEALSNNLPLTGAIIILVVLFLLWIIPELQVAHFKNMGVTNPKDLADLENSSRAILAQIIGGIGLFIGLYFTWRRIKIADLNVEIARRTMENNQKHQDINNEISQQTIKISQDGQIDERFTKAIEQLAEDRLELRLGGIYGLERIAKQSKESHWSVMEILTAYLRNNSHWNLYDEDAYTKLENLTMDTQAIITVIKRRKWKHEEEDQQLDLSSTYLWTANFAGVYLKGIDFRDSYLGATNFRLTDLREACFYRSYLGGADFYKADARKTIFWSANLGSADFMEANLEGANFGGANLEEASFQDAYLVGVNFREGKLENCGFFRANLKDTNFMYTNLKWTFFAESNLEMANFCKSQLEGADFENSNINGARFDEADLRGAQNLTIEQLSKVSTLYEAKLDDEIFALLNEKNPELFKKKPFDFYMKWRLF